MIPGIGMFSNLFGSMAQNRMASQQQQMRKDALGSQPMDEEGAAPSGPLGHRMPQGRQPGYALSGMRRTREEELPLELRDQVGSNLTGMLSNLSSMIAPFGRGGGGGFPGFGGPGGSMPGDIPQNSFLSNDAMKIMQGHMPFSTPFGGGALSRGSVPPGVATMDMPRPGAGGPFPLSALIGLIGRGTMFGPRPGGISPMGAPIRNADAMNRISRTGFSLAPFSGGLNSSF